MIRTERFRGAIASALASAGVIAAAAIAGCAGTPPKERVGAPPSLVILRTDPPMSDRSVRAWSVIEAHADAADGPQMRELGWTCTVTTGRDGTQKLELFDIDVPDDAVRPARAVYSETPDLRVEPDWHAFRLVRVYGQGPSK